MASYQAPSQSLVALIRGQLEGLGEEVMSKDARRCLVSYARHLERKGLARDGDHLVAGLLLNAAEMAAYIPSGKLGKGSLELTRLEERIERAQTAARRGEQRPRRIKGWKPERAQGWRTPPTRTPPTRTREPAGDKDNDAA